MFIVLLSAGKLGRRGLLRERKKNARTAGFFMRRLQVSSGIVLKNAVHCFTKKDIPVTVGFVAASF